jgi:hypothetical protein
MRVNSFSLEYLKSVCHLKCKTSSFIDILKVPEIPTQKRLFKIKYEKDGEIHNRYCLISSGIPVCFKYTVELEIC